MPGRFKEGDTVMAHSRGCIYEAKVLRADPANPSSYYIHFQGWGKRYDEWVTDDRLLEFNAENVALAKAVNEEMKAAAERKTNKGGEDKKGDASASSAKGGKGKKEEAATPTPAAAAAASGGGSGAKLAGRKRKLDTTRDVTDDGSGAEGAGPSVKFAFPWLIKRLVVEDWDMVSQKRFLSKVPREVPATVAPTLAPAASSSSSSASSGPCYAYQPHTVRSLCDLYLWSVARGGWGSHGVEASDLAPVPKSKRAKKAAAEGEGATSSSGSSSGGLTTPPLPSASAAASEVLAALSSSSSDVPPALRSAKEVVDGLRLYFDRCLPVHLLFRFEFLQYNAVASGLSAAGAASTTPMSAVYGPEHLLRLFVKLPELLAAGSVNAEDGDTIVAVVNDMMKFIVKYHTLFFSTSSAYARAKKDYVAAFENSITHLAGGGAGGGGSGAAGLSGLPRLTMADLFEAPAAVPGVEAAAAAV